MSSSNGDGLGTAMAPQPTTAPAIGATRGPGGITLWYSLHSAQPIVYVTTTIQAIVAGVPQGPKVIVPEWCIDLTANPLYDAALPQTLHSLAQPPNSNPVLIEVTYNTATQQGIPGVSTTA